MPIIETLKHTFKVIYAPRKAFNEIVQNPKYAGPLLILILFAVASIGAQYAQSTKVYLQQTSPSSLDGTDPWTEDYAMWESNGNITSNTQDRIFGYKSVQFNVTSDAAIWMKLNNIGSINCSGNSGYVNLTFSMKWINPTANKPLNASLYLYSRGAADYFYHNLTEAVSQSSSETWNNFTIPVGPTAVQWTNSSVNADWSNITSLKFDLVWSEVAESNLGLLVDKLFFQSQNFEPLANLFEVYVVTIVFNSITNFVFVWVLLSIILLVISRISHFKAEFKTFLIIIGYALIVMFVMQIVLSIFYLSLPALYVYIDTVVPNETLQTIITFSSVIMLLFPIWSLIISAIGVSVASKLPTSKSLIIAAVTFLPYYLFLLFV